VWNDQHIFHDKHLQPRHSPNNTTAASSNGKTDAFSCSFMNFMYRDNGLAGATRRSIDTQNKQLQIKMYQEYRAFEEVEMAEKR